MAAALITSEQTTLAKHEAVIERGLHTFIEVGNALHAIREDRLYRTSHDTFEEYCQVRWGFNRHRASQLITAAEVVTNVTTAGLPAPSNEGQARELARVPEADQVDVWQETLDRTEGKPTAAAVRNTYTTHADAGSPSSWLEPDDIPAKTPSAHPASETAKPKRRPLPEAFADATTDAVRSIDRLTRLRDDDRFTRNRDQTHHQMPELLGALNHFAALIEAMNLADSQADEEARRWWATSLHAISDTLAGAASTINQEI